MGNVFEIRYKTNCQSLLNGFPHALATSDIKYRFNFHIICGKGPFDGHTRSRSLFAAHDILCVQFMNRNAYTMEERVIFADENHNRVRCIALSSWIGVDLGNQCKE